MKTLLILFVLFGNIYYEAEYVGKVLRNASLISLWTCVAFNVKLKVSSFCTMCEK